LDERLTIGVGVFQAVHQHYAAKRATQDFTVRAVFVDHGMEPDGLGVDVESIRGYAVFGETLAQDFVGGGFGVEVHQRPVAVKGDYVLHATVPSGVFTAVAFPLAAVRPRLRVSGASTIDTPSPTSVT